jgi:hypothetical protein
MDPVVAEFVQTALALAALALAGLASYRAGGRHSHGEPPRLPEEFPRLPELPPERIEAVGGLGIEVVPAVREEVAAVVVPALRGPIALPRNPPPRVAPVCQCGVPGVKCRLHGAR